MATTSRPHGPRASRRRPRNHREFFALLVGALVTGVAATALAVPVAPTNSDGTLKVRTGQLSQVGPIA